MKKIMLFCAVLCAALTVAAKPVGVWRGNSCVRVNNLIMSTLFTPQWTNVDPQWIPFKGKEFNKVSAIVYLHGYAYPFRFREWKGNMQKQVEDFVRNGGTLIIIADGVPMGSAATRNLKALLGASKWAPFTGKAEFQDKRWADCGKDPQVFKHMLAGKDLKHDRAALTGLAPTAKMLVGNKSGALVVENKFGKGKVFFINIRLTESLTTYKQPYNQSANAALEQYWPFAKQLYRLLQEANVTMKKTKREQWDPTPIGPKCKAPEFRKRKQIKVVSQRKFAKLDSAPLRLIVDGKPNVIIAAGKPSERGAIRKLNSIVKAITGTAIPYTTSGALKAQGTKWTYKKKLYDVKIVFTPAEKINIRAEGNLISISAPHITMGFYALMREAFGYRMLWPGKEGEVFMAPTKNLTINAFTYSDAPGIRQRYIRDSMNTFLNRAVKAAHQGKFSIAAKRTGFDPRVIAKARAPYNRREWWSANLLGGGIGGEGGGANFYSWYKRFGKTHPEYMGLQFNGTRKMKTDHVRICKSNPAVIKQAVDDVRRGLAKKKRNYVRFSPSDGGYDTFCMCPNCRKWDPSDGVRGTSRVFPGSTRPVFRYTSMTDRVLRFTVECAKELKKTHPHVKVSYLAYAGYLRPPQYFSDISQISLVTYVGIGYLSDRGRAIHRKYWDFWAGLVDEMRWRPNFLGSGNGLPFIYPHRMDDDIKHFAATGMIAGDFDTLPHHWATQGLNYYVLATLLWDPARNVDDIINEYCTMGFGAGADDMKAYYARLEKLTDKYSALDGEDVTQTEDLTQGRNLNANQKFLLIFTPEEFVALRKHIAAAKAKVAPGSKEAARIEFISAGFEFTAERTGLWRKIYATPGKERGKLRPEIDEWVEKCHKFQVEHPYAISMPGIVGSDFYGFWRSCGWKAKGGIR